MSSRGPLTGASRLRYLPLGGLGEVGINMWALEWENKVLVVDAGLMFPQEDMLGIDLVLPDISYLLQGGKLRRIGNDVIASHGIEVAMIDTIMDLYQGPPTVAVNTLWFRSGPTTSGIPVRRLPAAE